MVVVGGGRREMRGRGAGVVVYVGLRRRVRSAVGEIGRGRESIGSRNLRAKPLQTDLSEWAP